MALAAIAVPAGSAVAAEAADEILAARAVLAAEIGAGVVQTFVAVRLAPGPRVRIRTEAEEAVELIHARPAVLARARGAFVLNSTASWGGLSSSRALNLGREADVVHELAPSSLKIPAQLEDGSCEVSLGLSVARTQPAHLQLLPS